MFVLSESDAVDLLCLKQYSTGLIPLVRVNLDDHQVGSWINILSECCEINQAASRFGNLLLEIILKI